TELLKKKIVAPGADHEPDRATAKSQQEALAEQLSYDLPARCAHREPDGNLLERAVPRASSMLARFRQAISNTAPAIAMSNVAIDVIGPSSSGCVLKLKRDGVGICNSRAPSLSAGWMAVSRCARTGRRDFAISMVMPDRIRPVTLKA